MLRITANGTAANGKPLHNLISTIIMYRSPAVLELDCVHCEQKLSRLFKRWQFFPDTSFMTLKFHHQSHKNCVKSSARVYKDFSEHNLAGAHCSTLQVRPSDDLDN